MQANPFCHRATSTVHGKGNKDRSGDPEVGPAIELENSESVSSDNAPSNRNSSPPKESRPFADFEFASVFDRTE